MAQQVRNSGNIARATQAQVRAQAQGPRPVPAPAAQKPRYPIISTINKYADQIGLVLPEHVGGLERFIRISISAINQTPKLAECSEESILGALLRSAQFGLEPNTPTGEAYLIPRKGKCNFQLGYKGLMKLGYRTGKIVDFEMGTIGENEMNPEHLHIEYGKNRSFILIPDILNPGRPVAFYAGYHTTSGEFAFDVMSAKDAIAHGKKHSQAYNDPRSPWQTDPKAMCQKTVMIRLLKKADLSTEIQEALNIDSTIQEAVLTDDPTQGVIMRTDYDVTPALQAVDDPLSFVPELDVPFIGSTQGA